MVVRQWNDGVAIKHKERGKGMSVLVVRVLSCIDDGFVLESGDNQWWCSRL